MIFVIRLLVRTASFGCMFHSRWVFGWRCDFGSIGRWLASWVLWSHRWECLVWWIGDGGRVVQIALGVVGTEE